MRRVGGMGWTGTEAGKEVGQCICMCRVYGFQISLRASPMSWLKLECLVRLPWFSWARICPPSLLLCSGRSLCGGFHQWHVQQWWICPAAIVCSVVCVHSVLYWIFIQFCQCRLYCSSDMGLCTWLLSCCVLLLQVSSSQEGTWWWSQF